MECQNQAQLSYDDIKELFSGAPHFAVITGEDGKPHPEILFPWDQQLEIADLLDRRVIRHESFASFTLHAHLPIPSPVRSATDSLPRALTRKRPAFEFGVFEVPNMLNYQGKESGTIGMRHFLELPVSDAFRTEQQLKQQRLAATITDINKMTSTEAFKAMKLNDQNMNLGKDSAWRDRQMFVQDRASWKNLGVRYISMDVLTSRAAVVGPWYDKMAKEGWRRTILDEMDVTTCYNELFALILHLPPHHRPQGNAQPDRGLNVQIEALVNVLATPGAWIDFSLTESRLRFGEILWEVPDSSASSATSTPGADRHWLLVQLLLSIELAIRLDAALRDQKVHHSEGTIIPEIQLFHSLRNRKVDWDLVMARAFLDNNHVEDHAGAFPPPTRPGVVKRKSSRLFSRWRQRVEEGESSTNNSDWDFVIIPRDLGLQVEGLLQFAESIHWPHLEQVRGDILSKVDRWNSAKSFDERKTFVGPLQCRNMSSKIIIPSSIGMPQQVGLREKEELSVKLTPASETESGGWLSRSWFAGLVLPGESASHFLISALLEHDPTALKEVGPNGNLRGGFVLDGQSWWSKSCIVGRVMAAEAGGAECMGWIHTPKFQPVDQSEKALPNGWLTVTTNSDPHTHHKSRINSGRKVSNDSNPVGNSDGDVKGTDFLCTRDGPIPIENSSLKLEKLVLKRAGVRNLTIGSVKLISNLNGSAEPANVDWNLTYDVHFISGQPCRVPVMKAVAPPSSAESASPATQEPLYSHPLHKCFHYTVKTLPQLLGWTPPEPSKATKGSEETYVIDARGEKAYEVLARAWCAMVGHHAIVSRVGRTCLSCSIREARALAVQVVIRI